MDLYGHQIKGFRDWITKKLLPQGYLHEVKENPSHGSRTVALSIPRLIDELDNTLQNNTRAALTLDERDRNILTRLIDSPTTRAIVREIFPTEKIRENQSFDLCLLLTSLLWSRGTASQVPFSLSERLGAEILLETNPDLFADMKDQLSSNLAAEFGLSEKHRDLQRMSVETLVNLRALFEKVKPPAPLIEKLKWAMMPFGAPEAYIFERFDRNLNEIISEVAKGSLSEYHSRRKRRAE